MCFQADEDEATPQSHTVDIQSLTSEERNVQTVERGEEEEKEEQEKDEEEDKEKEEEEEDKEEEEVEEEESPAPVTVSSFLKYSLKHQ